MSKNIFLVYSQTDTPVRGTRHTDYPPMGALYVADALEQANFYVTLIPSNMDEALFASKLLQNEPLFVGFSVHTFPTIRDMVGKSKLAKGLGLKTVWGGNHPTCLPDQCLEEEYIDYIVSGDGESEATYLAELFHGGKASEYQHRFGHFAIMGLDNYIPAWHHINLENYLFPASHSVRDGDSAERIFYYLMTSRGCPFNCAFCYNSRQPKQPFRAHSAEWVIKQVEWFKKNYAIDGIGFWDDAFFTKFDRASTIIEHLRSIDVKFLVEGRVDMLVVDHFTSWLKDTGCLQVFVGAESGSDRVLEMIGKNITVSEILEAAEMTYKHNLPARFSFIYGFPCETWGEMVATRDLVEELRAYPNVSISGPKLYTPYPGTAMYQKALQAGFVPPETTEGWADIHRFTDLKHLPWLDEELRRHNKTLGDLL